jgi:hypothetical protein
MDRAVARAVIATFAPPMRAVISGAVFGKVHPVVSQHLLTEARRKMGHGCPDARKAFQCLLAEWQRRFAAAAPAPEIREAVVDAGPLPRKPRAPRPPKKQRVPDIVTADDGAIGLPLGRSGKRAWFDACDRPWATQFRWMLLQGRPAYIAAGKRQSPASHLLGCYRMWPVDGDPTNCRRSNLLKRPPVAPVEALRPVAPVALEADGPGGPQ